MAVFSMPVLRNSWTITVACLGAAVVLTIVLCRRRRRHAPEIIVCSTQSEWAAVSRRFVQQASDGFLGVDCEWVSSKSGANKVALLQVAPSKNLCVLVRLCQMEIPEELQKVLADFNIMKFGVAVMDDAKKLYNDYGIKMTSCLDLRYLALASGYESDGTQGLSLAALASHYAQYELNKSSHVRRSNWEARKLSPEQIDYAARDAFAGIHIACGLMQCSALASVYDSCYFEFYLYLDIPFRKAALKSKHAQKNRHAQKQPSPPSSSAQSVPASRKPVTRSDQKIYKNAVMKAPDGEILCNTDVVKTDWYLKMGLATLESDDPLVIRLTFEPRCRAVLGGEFYVDEKPNICVVCGADRLLLKKNVVPLEYRKLFPELLKSHTSHDSVLVCIDCQQRSTTHDAKLRATLDAECAVPAQVPMLQALKRAARALKSAADKLPEAKREHFVALLEKHFKEPLSERIIDEALGVDEHKWMRANGLTHAQRVVTKYSETDGLFALESRFRQHFLDSMQPRHLSPKWSVVHNHDAVLMKMATGRYPGPLTFDEFLRVVGASWQRVGELVISITAKGIVDSSQVVVWKQLIEEGFEMPNNNTQSNFGGAS